MALLRGVNVGRHHDPLAPTSRDVFRDLGFDEVRTVPRERQRRASSGCRDAYAPHRAEEAGSRQALRERFGYDAWILLVTRASVAAAITAFPFDAADAAPPALGHLLRRTTATRDELDGCRGIPRSIELDPVAPGNGVVYWNPVEGRTTDTPFAKVLARARVQGGRPPTAICAR